jgi:hypothetical protein
MSRVRSWLERNKIYFETLLVGLPSAASLVVSIFACFVAFRAANDTSVLMERQARAQELVELPFIVVYHQLSSDDNSNNFTQDSLVISNDGSPLRNFQCTEAVFLVVEVANLRAQGSRGTKRFEIPVNAYFFVHFLKTGPKGELARLTATGNYKKFVDLATSIDALASADNWYGEMRIESHIKVTYQLPDRKEVTQYFKCTSSSYVEEDERVGRQFLQNFQSSSRSDFFKITAEEIWNSAKAKYPTL